MAGTPDYPALLVVAARLYGEAMVQQSNARAVPGAFPIYFTPFDDGTVLILQAPLDDPAKAQPAITKLQEQLDVALARPVTPADAAQVDQMCGPFLGTLEVPDAMWAKNPHGLGFSIVRRHQLGLDPLQLKQAIEAVTDDDLERLAKTVFHADRRVTVIAELP